MTPTVTALRGRDSTTVQAAVDAFLSSARCANPNTRRGYAGVLDRLLAELGADRRLATLGGDELADLLERLWAAANAPNYYQKLRIDEMWLGWSHPSPPGSATTTYEAESGVTSGWARVVNCTPCSGGAKVTKIGNDVGNDLALTVNVPKRGRYLVTLVGSAPGTRSVSLAVNDEPTFAVPLTGSSELTPLLARSVPLELRRGTNTIRFFNHAGYAPDLDRITVSPL